MIWLTLPGIGRVAATVRWADDFEAGCQFGEPIGEASSTPCLKPDAADYLYASPGR